MLTSLLVEFFILKLLTIFARLLTWLLLFQEGPFVLKIALFLQECLVLILLLLFRAECAPLLAGIGQKVSFHVRLVHLAVFLLLAQPLDEEHIGRQRLGHNCCCCSFLDDADSPCIDLLGHVAAHFVFLQLSATRCCTMCLFLRC